MPSKYTLRNFQENHFYHIFNRGATKQKIYLSENDYHTFTSILKYYLLHPTGKPLSHLNRYSSHSKIQDPTLVSSPIKLISYCLMPNHFHLLLKQVTSEKSQNISNLMRRLSITYSMYFNTTHKKSGAIFQGKFKNVHIKSDEQLVHTSKYIHLNPKKSLNRFQNLENYPYSNYPAYTSINSSDSWINTNEIYMLDYFSNSKNPTKACKKFINKSLDPTKYQTLT